MATDLDALLSQLPDGADIFVSVQQFLDEQVYPDLGAPFWVQVHVLTALHVLAGILFLVGLAAKAKQGRLNFILRDGSCSHIDLKFAMPVLWFVAVILEIAFAVCFQESFKQRYFSNFIGAAWYLVYVPSAVSYTLLSASVVASAPPVRRYLGRVSYGVLRYNFGVGFVMAASLVGIITPAMMHADGMTDISKAHTTISQAIADANAKQDMVALLGVMDLLPILEKANIDYRHVSQLASGVYACFMFFYLVSGAIPAIILARSVLHKIARLEAKKNVASDSYNAESIMTEHVALPHLTNNCDDNDITPSTLHIPEQPKDRPFAQLIDLKTTTYPHRFHVVLQAEDQSSSQRAENLKAVLRTELLLLSLYFGIILVFLAGTLFMAGGGTKHFSAKREFIWTYSYFTWSFAFASLILGGLLLWDALRPSQPHERNIRQGNTVTKNYFAPTASVIKCEQVVNVTYVAEDDTLPSTQEKKQLYASKLRDV